MAQENMLWVRHKVQKTERAFNRASFERGGFKKHYEIIGEADANGQFIPGSEVNVPNSKPQSSAGARQNAAPAVKPGEVRAPKLLKKQPAEVDTDARNAEAAAETGGDLQSKGGIMDIILQEPDIAPQPVKEEAVPGSIPPPPPLPSTVPDVAMKKPAPAEAANDLPAAKPAPQATPRRRTPKAQQ